MAPNHGEPGLVDQLPQSPSLGDTSRLPLGSVHDARMNSLHSTGFNPKSRPMSPPIQQRVLRSGFQAPKQGTPQSQHRRIPSYQATHQFGQFPPRDAAGASQSHPDLEVNTAMGQAKQVRDPPKEQRHALNHQQDTPRRSGSRPQSPNAPLTPVSMMSTTAPSLTAVDAAPAVASPAGSGGRPSSRLSDQGATPGRQSPSLTARSTSHRRHHSRIAAPIGDMPDIPEEMHNWRSDTPLMSPQFEEMGMFAGRTASVSSANSRPVSGEQQWSSLQEILSILAQKERQVLEARESLADAEEALVSFRARVDRMLGPVPSPLAIPVRPVIIVRRHHPNVGINALSYAQVLDYTAIASPWDLDVDGDVEEKRLSLSLRVVNALLNMVHCIIKTLPTYQSRGGELLWRPEYPSPTRTLYAFVSYEL